MSIFNSSSDIKMFDEQSFYRAFEKDLHLARRSVIIESPFITLRRILYFKFSFDNYCQHHKSNYSKECKHT